jgi:hypothetical protein
MEELVDMIDVSVSSKYGADLEGMTCTLMDSLHGSVESFKAECKQDSENALSRQVRATIQPVLGEVRDTHDTDVASASMTAPGRSLPLVQRLPHPSVGRVANPNLPQPYYQTSSYGTHAPVVPDAYFARRPVTHQPQKVCTRECLRALEIKWQEHLGNPG